MTNKITQVYEESKYEPSNLPKEQTKLLEEAHRQNELLDNVREEQLKKEKLNEMDIYDQLLKQFKTKSF